MLRWIHPHHFARFSAENQPKERRLLRLAHSDDHNTQNTPEQMEPLSETPGTTPSAHILELIEKNRADVAALRPRIIQAVCSSPSLLRQLQRRTDDPRQRAAIDAHINALFRGKADQPSEQLQTMLESALDTPQKTLELAELFEGQMQSFYDAKRQLENVKLQEAAKVEIELNQNGKLDLLTQQDTWEIAEVRALLHRIGIEVPDDGAQDAETKRTLLLRLHSTLRAARIIALVETQNFGTETTLDEVEEAEKRFFEQLIDIRRVVDTHIVQRAAALEQAYEKKILPIKQRYANDPERIPSELQVSTSAYVRRMAEIADTLCRAQRQSAAKRQNLPAITAASYTQAARTTLQEIENVAWLEQDKEEKALLAAMLGKEQESELGSDRQQHAESMEWARRIAPQYAAAITQLKQDPTLLEEQTKLHGRTNGKQWLQEVQNIAGMLQRIADGSPTLEDTEELYHTFSSQQARQRHELLIASILYSTTRKHAITSQQKQEAKNAPALSALQQQYDALQERLFPQGNLHPALRHQVVTQTGIEQMLHEHVIGIRSKIENGNCASGQIGQSERNAAAAEMQRLTECVVLLDALNHDDASIVIEADPETYRSIAGTLETNGSYDIITGRIYLNKTALPSTELKAGTLYHEKGHAILDILARRTGVLPGIFVATGTLLATRHTDGRTFQELLEAQAQRWRIAHLEEKLLAQERENMRKEPQLHGTDRERTAHARAKARYRELLIDELLNKYASWLQSNRNTPVTQEEAALFALLDGGTSVEHHLVLSETSDGDATETDDTQTPQETRTGGSRNNEDIADVGQKFRDTHQQLNTIAIFLDSHPTLHNKKEWQEWLQKARGIVQEIENDYNAGHTNEQDVITQLEIANQEIKKNSDAVEKYQQAELDLTKASPTGIRGIRGVFANIQWLCLYDIYNMVKDAGEDIHRIWKRRGERVRNELGETLTSWAPDSFPYAGQLKHEYHRRSDASRLEEVEQWKKALNETDSYSLQNMLTHTRNHDQLRAILELLSDRGRLNWNDEGFWNTLNALSKYSMPIAACRNNDVLRDKWLQKLITDIWDDKEHWYNWRRTNDSNYNSEMEKYTQYVDQLSNVSNGLSGELENMLRLWVEYRQGPPGDIPNEVNPHKYEKILIYAIGNGKMRMEDKFFYLVQGVANGLLSIDRLRVLAGEVGGVLNQFPLLDYFYQKNNSLPEVQALATRMREAPWSSPDAYRPGAKTTLWIHLEATRTESARQRISKATSGTRLEKIDHEDIPTMVSILDYEGMNLLSDVVSGGRLQMSPEAQKNSYTGFATLWLAKARIVQLEDRGLARFTTQDIRDIARSMAASIHLDNILTGNATEKSGRARLSWGAINQSQGPSTGGHLVKKVRDGNYAFVHRILDETNFNFANVKDREGNNIERKDYVRPQDDQSSKGANHQKSMFYATESFAQQLEDALLQNPETVKAVLREFARRADTNDPLRLIPEHDTSISLEEAERYVQQQRRSTYELGS
ncbi:hypothetical protein GX553_00770 [Candidatus Peribacteria bacterium]|nr:hypothetical protein [Candidatus Peribacteria bacterium]